MSNHVIVFNGRDNTQDIVLLSDGVVVDPTSITRVIYIVGGVTIDSQSSPSAFSWPTTITYQGNSAKSIRTKFGGAGLVAKTYYDGRLIVYDSANPGGMVWMDAIETQVIS